MTPKLKYLPVIAAFASFSSITFADEKPQVAQPLQWKAVSLSIPLEGQYLMISKNSFFYEGKVLSKKQFSKSIEAKDKIDGKQFIAFSAMKGCPNEDFIAVFNELHEKGFAVCASSHSVDLNSVYRRLADSNEQHLKTQSEQGGEE